MKILVIDNNMDREDWGSKNLRKLAQLSEGATVITRRGPHDDLPESPRAFDRVIASGSATSCLKTEPWIEHLHRFIRETIDAGVPYLGVCYGHQSLVRALGSRENVRKGEQAEYGWTEIEQTGENALFKGLPKKFYSFSSHSEEVQSLPGGLRSFARSERCAIQAIELPGKPVYGVQFHPEKDLDGGEKIFREERAKGRRDLLNPAHGRRLHDTKVAEAIFRNFLAETIR